MELTDRSPGRVTCRKRCQALAPSISAASYRAPSMDCSPPSSETIMNGTPHQVLTMIAANRCQKVSSSHSGVGRCTASSIELMMPPSASMNRQPKTVTKVGTAHGSTRISR